MNGVHSLTVGKVAHIYLQVSPTPRSLMNWTTAFGHSTGLHWTLGRTSSDMVHVDIPPPPRAGTCRGAWRDVSPNCGVCWKVFLAFQSNGCSTYNLVSRCWINYTVDRWFQYSCYIEPAPVPHRANLQCQRSETLSQRSIYLKSRLYRHDEALE